MSMLLPYIPYSYKGFSNELANAWKQNPQTLIRGVDDRKYGGDTPVSPTGVPPVESTSVPTDEQG